MFFSLRCLLCGFIPNNPRSQQAGLSARRGSRALGRIAMNMDFEAQPPRQSYLWLWVGAQESVC